MMAENQILYSLIVVTPQPITLSEPTISLEAGRNVCTVLADDIDGLLGVLRAQGATVLQVNILTQPPTTPLDMVLEGETPTSVLGADYGQR